MAFYANYEKECHDRSDAIDIDAIISASSCDIKKAFAKSVSYQVKHGQNEETAKKYLVAEILSSGFSESVLVSALEYEGLASPKMAEKIAPILINLKKYIDM